MGDRAEQMRDSGKQCNVGVNQNQKSPEGQQDKEELCVDTAKDAYWQAQNAHNAYLPTRLPTTNTHKTSEALSFI